MVSIDVLNFVDAPCEKKVYKIGKFNNQPNNDNRPIKVVRIAKTDDILIVLLSEKLSALNLNIESKIYLNRV